jgi:hypothetical protein
MHIILETPRLVLRQFTGDDVDNLFDLNSDPEVMRFLTGGRPTPRAEIQDQIIPFHLAVYERLDRLGTWAAESAATGEFLDWFHFIPGPDGDTANTELGYRLRRPAWNKGYATEGSRALISVGFTALANQARMGSAHGRRCPRLELPGVVITWAGKRVWRDDDRAGSFQPTVTPPGEVRPMNAVSVWVLPLAVTTGD